MGKRKTEQRIKAIELHKQDFQGDKLLNGLVCALIPLRRG